MRGKRNIKNALLFVVVALTAFSCLSPQERAARRVERLLGRFPALSDTVVTVTRDTLVELDSVFIDAIHLDTVVNIQRDSVFVFTEDRVTTEVQVFNRETIRVRTEVRADTVVVRDTFVTERVRTVERVKVEKTKAPSWCRTVAAGAGLLLLFAFFIFAMRVIV